MNFHMKKKWLRGTRTWYISTTMMGSSARTFRESDPRGMMECCEMQRGEATVSTNKGHNEHRHRHIIASIGGGPTLSPQSATSQMAKSWGNPKRFKSPKKSGGCGYVCEIGSLVWR